MGYTAPVPQQRLGVLYYGRIRLQLVVGRGRELVGAIFDGSDIMLSRLLGVERIWGDLGPGETTGTHNY